MPAKPSTTKTKKIPSLQLIQDDPWLESNEQDIIDRLERFKNQLKDIKKNHKTLSSFASMHQYLGTTYDAKKKGYWFREWAPAAQHLAIVGDFNTWNGESHPLQKLDFGVWETFISSSEIKHQDVYKIRVTSQNGIEDRLPAYAHRAVQDENTNEFKAQLWFPKKKFKWTDQKFDLSSIKAPVIYECHIGMAQEKEGIGTYKEFEDFVLPRIKKLGYNCIQMMAVQEHPYYGSFGYHVSNFFAPSSRFGTPEELKSLINTAHKLGIAIIMDIVHSHAVKNTAEGLNGFDGSDNQYFHEGTRGEHDQWDSKLFNYGKPEVQQFLLSNVKYWMEEFHFDGFRFDGVTSMLYYHHGNISFDHYDKYFKDGVEWDAITYLQLANQLMHEINPNAISIAEDMSGMPGLCRQIEEGGVGFDYRLGMGIPDYWIKVLKHKRDEEWNIHEIWDMLLNRRWKEKTIAYAESHDQALVGDKTLAFWLMDKEMYWHMDLESETPVIDRGLALHKMLRLMTGSAGGEGYLNFIGNEFGHPEWVDFPREGNGWSHQYARRQWSLVDNQELKYKFLNQFDQDMITLFTHEGVLEGHFPNQLNMDDTNKVIIFERASLIFIFNLHPVNSIPDYKFWVPEKGNYRIVLNSDRESCGGFGRINEKIKYSTNKDQQLSLYLTNRTALVLKKD